MDLLIKHGIIRNTKHGYVNAKGTEIGYYRTKGSARKRYIQDKYVDILVKIK